MNFIGQDYVNINEIQETLHKYQLKVNKDKTEFTALSKNEEDWKNAKKVGSLIGDSGGCRKEKTALHHSPQQALARVGERK